MAIVSKYSTGERVYYIVRASADIIPATVSAVFLEDDEGIIRYDVVDTVSFKTRYNLIESDLHTFAEAKSILVAWLQEQVIKVNSLSGI